MGQNKLRFSKDNIEFVNELRAKVKEYFEQNNISKFGNTGIVLKSLLMLALYSMPYILMLSGIITIVPVMLVCWLVMGFGMAGMGMVLMHDANHKSFSKNKTVNKWLSKSAYLLGAYPPNWQYQHNTLHHSYTNIEGQDEDIAPIGVLRFSPHKPLLKVHKYQYIYAWFFYCLMTISWVTGKDFSRLIKYKKEDSQFSNTKIFRRSLIELIISKIIYYIVFLIIPLVLIPISWYWIVAGFIGMHFVCGLILSTIFQAAHVVPESTYPLPDKSNNLENNWAVHQLFTTSDFSPGSKIFSWLIGGLNYQIEHHLFPTISHVHYKRISQIVKETAAKYKLPYNVHSNFFKAVGKHAQMLKILGS